MIEFAFLLAFPSLSFCESWAFDQSLPCLVNPVASVRAGETLNFQLFNSRNSTCEVTLDFADPAFLPLSLTVHPRDCAGDQTASFILPLSVPNGTVTLQWQCVRSPSKSCLLLDITGGTGDHEKIQLEQADLTAHVKCGNSTSFLSPIPGQSPNSFTLSTPTPSCSEVF
ncbi:hypothetical protein K469DRAFT_706221 [Zopfia rhizophila CBS 207.26]|uniref:Ubiquitin 3 binding protein But2 C-terminal domain-containing protein n=1 Tax=Zopfia rhizophila CBS 207.26 TaxID=1314779 RepID=A0A6A6ERD3_9PEZI|nr:hypothetical protein K469DRAFT_706221 [Zopfia rhizophila CBS 207.26]